MFQRLIYELWRNISFTLFAVQVILVAAISTSPHHIRLNPVSGKKKIKKIFLSSTSSSCVSCMYISFMPFMYELITFHIIICIKAHTERYTDATISILNLYAKTNGEIMLNGREVNFFYIFYESVKDLRKLKILLPFCWMLHFGGLKKTWNFLRN